MARATGVGAGGDATFPLMLVPVPALCSSVVTKRAFSSMV